MRLGHVSAINFGSQILASLSGFVATLYVAQELGSAALGKYALFIAVVIWMKTFFGSGLHEGVRKRLSERGERRGILGAALAIQVGLLIVVGIVILLFHSQVNHYLRFDGADTLIGAFVALIAFAFVRSVLDGEDRVHLSSLLRPLDRVVRTGVQLSVVFLGAFGGGVLGITYGYIAGAATASLLGFVWIRIRPAVPSREDFRSLWSYLQYAWLSGIEERSISSMDTVVLGLFVASNLIGYYEVAWNVASILAVFGTSISTTVFPTLSKLESEGKQDQVGEIISQSLAFSGLFVIPGLAGGMVIGDQILGIYGPEFEQASLVLLTLIFARLVYAYESQLISALNAIGRPEIAFRINAIFVASILSLNLILVNQFGWIGAAVGTAVAAMIGLVLAYKSLSEVVDFALPTTELTTQFISAITMAGVVAWLETSWFTGLRSETFTAILLVAVGAVVYFLTLATTSSRFRGTVRNNLPF
ncbi:polysaccharide biosynthesis C-terminal domain-containing protein [Halorubrum ezzemoulense]|uniref:Polysaccharide biosynthesis C-terminal domain-containing protein n=1 Tax=Halorubrum ezzemoulense TaxID=337243 RepID=A0ABT4Z2P3_HALEZ|nr:polysaccharide biosynthesis C-terminal domain-containing protein [Halorubrum ezzemoulense]MDB2244331.1 polysaccharide biosynthesis C-terminal domain-containing protein [Halorubrum ezzemoulense]MDB2278912.1 polysaccharide biosynthesis C-terminal domain-containing protein [Halorubrum ezzemoulense]MDB2287665.1 polysaccharide biosynthesis C-terminal domain-containing protein [Halorubrum ezzemoulense]MDB2291790.1 polysaccharide biosynthesis C-terminal domain-containing protein [Halorubrum ezzemou